MKGTLIGKKIIQFTNKEGKEIKGTKIFFTHEIDGVIGRESDDYFLKDGIDISNIKINDDIEIYFDRNGKVEKIQKL